MKYTVQLFCLFWLVYAANAFADDVRVAVASNFYKPMQEIANEFEALTAHRVVISPGSSGKLYAQILNGAPFDLFFSADQEKPQALVKAGGGDPESLFTYAIGKLVLWSSESDLDVQAKLLQGDYRRLALANPRLAPYGKAAVDTLVSLGLDGADEQKKWVRGENIAQTWHFVSSANTELGFVAMSQVLDYGEDRGSAWIIPQAMHDPIRQDALLLTNSRQVKAASEFMDFVKSRRASEIIESFGYDSYDHLSGQTQ